jgi:hypothetical protein
MDAGQPFIEHRERERCDCEVLPPHVHSHFRLAVGSGNAQRVVALRSRTFHPPCVLWIDAARRPDCPAGSPAACQREELEKLKNGAPAANRKVDKRMSLHLVK